jgi:transposase
MKTYNFRPYDQQQTLMCSLVPGDLLDDDHPARVFDRIIESLDLSSLYRKYSKEGNPAYHPKMMLKVLLYSYRGRTRSCRGMEKALETCRVDYFFLSSGQMPDFRTINDFRLRHLDVLPSLFAQVVFLCNKLGLVGYEHLAIDGEKIEANASFRKSYSAERLQKRLKKIERAVEALLREESETDEVLARDIREKRAAKLLEEKKRLQELNTLIEVANAVNPEIKANINMTDPDAKVMTHKNGEKVPSYNHQSAVDSAYGVTVAVATSNSGDQPKDLLPLADQAIANTGGTFENVSADSGFCDYEQLQKVAEERQENFHMPDKHMESDKDSSEKKKFPSGSFARQEDGTVICPAGKTMRVKAVNQKEDHQVTIHAGIECESCSLREKCTASAERTISVDSREKYRDIMRAKLSSVAGREEYRRRQYTVEPVHGHEQHNHGWRMHHLRGMARASAEFILMRIILNIEKIMRFRPGEVYAFG